MSILLLLHVLHVFYLVMEFGCKRVTIPHNMRTHSGATEDTPSSSYGRQPTPPPPNPPPAPTLVDTIASLINVSAKNVHLLQAIVQDHIPAQ
jgi:hypothetical protein